MENEKRLIDVKPFMKAGWHLVRTGKSNEHLASLSLADVPTVDAVEVVHGRWVDAYGIRKSKCENCGVAFGRVMEDCYYCPNCGAKMDGDGNG